MANPLRHVLEYLIEKGATKVQLNIRGAGMMGPGRLELVELPIRKTERASSLPEGYPEEKARDLYRFYVQSAVQLPSAMKGMPPQVLEATLPIIFCSDDVVWVSEGPIDDDGNPIVIDTPKAANQQRKKSSLEI
ncbi:MAG TPA: hypothetical protein VFD36_20480 [Kofleriaceae bacterium]|nr:hypothetical protein [Kofleriaceae bacterium]